MKLTSSSVHPLIGLAAARLAVTHSSLSSSGTIKDSQQEFLPTLDATKMKLIGRQILGLSELCLLEVGKTVSQLNSSCHAGLSKFQKWRKSLVFQEGDVFSPNPIRIKLLQCSGAG